MKKLSVEELKDAAKDIRRETGQRGTKKEIRLRAIKTRIIEATQNFGGRSLTIGEMDKKEAEILKFFKIAHV